MSNICNFQSLLLNTDIEYLKSRLQEKKKNMFRYFSLFFSVLLLLLLLGRFFNFYFFILFFFRWLVVVSLYFLLCVKYKFSVVGLLEKIIKETDKLNKYHKNDQIFKTSVQPLEEFNTIFFYWAIRCIYFL